MSKKLKIRTLRLEKLPYGKYTWMVTIIQENNVRPTLSPNAAAIAPFRELLDNAGTGSWRFNYVRNWRRNKVWDKIYLTHSMDVAMLKLCHSDSIRKIYKIEVIGKKAKGDNPP